MLQDLPNEILAMIADQLPPPTLRALSQTCRKLYCSSVSQLYREVTFRAKSEWALNVLDIDNFLFHHPGGAKHLLHTRHLAINAPIHLTRFNRCAAFNIFRAAGLAIHPFSTLGTPDDAKAHRQFLGDILDQLLVAFALLRSGFLHSFTWRLGTCLPSGVLDADGYLIRHQQTLVHLKLVTDGSCPHAASHLEGLAALTALESLKWEGIQHPVEIRQLQQCIHRNKKHLKTLSIKFNASAGSPDFGRDVLGLHGFSPLTTSYAESSVGFLPSLTSLELTRARFRPSLYPHTLSIAARVRSLTLHDCIDSLDFLEQLNSSQSTLQLQRFELSCDQLEFHPHKSTDLGPLIAFLMSFRGLKHLKLKLSNFSRFHQIEAAVRHQYPTLETFVHHEKELAPIDDESLWWGTRDVYCSWISGEESLCLGQLSALALCTDPSSLRTNLGTETNDSQVQLLHFRLTGVDYLHRNFQAEVISQIETRGEAGSCGHWGGLPRRSSLPDDLEFATLWEEPPMSLRTAVLDDSDMSDMSSVSGVLGAFCSEASEIKAVLDFADWAFGSTGLPKLQVLAFGDFSHEERHQNQRFLLRRKLPNLSCRSGHNSPAVKGNHDGWILWAGDMNEPALWADVCVDGVTFLSACPDGGLMESPEEW